MKSGGCPFRTVKFPKEDCVSLLILMAYHLKTSKPLCWVSLCSSFLCRFLSFSLRAFFFFFIFISVIGVAAEADQFHVLAVDDSIIDRKLIETLLKTSSYHVTAVHSGSKALEFLGLQEEEEEQNDANIPSVSPSNHHQDLEVNLIIADYFMPGMTGYDLLRKIKDIPAIIMSSENEPSRIYRCLEDGAEEFFLKPVQLSDVKKLRHHLLKRCSKGNQHAINTTEITMEQESQTTERDKETYTMTWKLSN